MSNPKLSLDLFNQAVAAKRQGHYDEAIRLQKQSIAAYPEDPDLMQNFYSMGKTYYLAGDYASSYTCYQIYDGLCIIRNPPILEDFISLCKGDKNAMQRFVLSFRNLANHIGHASLDKNNAGANEVLWYKSELAGKNPQNISSLSGYAGAAEQYNNKCIEMGFKSIEKWTKKFILHSQVEQKNILNLMNKIVES